MAASYVIERTCDESLRADIAFAGDGVRLAGQLDFPRMPKPLGRGYPLAFIIPNAGSNSLEDFRLLARAVQGIGYATFRWDKRCTGRSGAAGCGSPAQDAINAYETALSQPNLDTRRIVIVAFGEGTHMLAENFSLFRRIGQPHGVALIANMLDEHAILGIDAPVFIAQGECDWNDPARYAQAAAAAHRSTYTYGAEVIIAEGADRNLMLAHDGNRTFHLEVAHAIQDWLKAL